MQNRYRIHNRIILGLLVWSMFTGSNVLAQQSTPQALFDQSLILYRNGQYEQARINLYQLVALGRENPVITASTFMLAKTLFHLEQNIDAEHYARTLVDQFPDSRYIGYAKFLLARLAYERGEYAQAIETLLMVVESGNPQLLRASQAFANDILALSIDPGQLEPLLERNLSMQSRNMLQLWIARAYYGRGNLEQGHQKVEALLDSNPGELVSRAAETLASLPPDSLAYPVRFGISLPMSGYFEEEASDFLRGVAYAKSLRDKAVPEIDLIVKDSRGRNVDAAINALDFSPETVSLVIGDLTGSLSATLAGVLTEKGVPLIIPLATDIGITHIGEKVFQANSNLEIRGQNLAQYTIQSLGMKTFATLAPADDYGQALTDAFTSTIDRMGGKIVSQQWYYPGAEDFSRQFYGMREAGLRLALRDSLEQQGLPVTTERMDSLWMALEQKTIQESEERTGLVKTTDIPINSIDGIFLPIYAEDLNVIAPQMALYNINAIPLGGSYWLDEEILNSHRRYINNALFVTGNYVMESNPEYIRFRNEFRLYTGATPGQLAIFGYNLFNLLISAIDTGNTDSDDFVNYLNNVRDYPVLGGSISFVSSNRVNQSVNLFRYRDGILEKIENLD
ncbi:ABC transporter substrate-binding protein [candidate division KSB1 bacterium]|nr:ABC transporter substrate-binding protein [candidate division KSB1 bacterium]